jgi:hypothetical protein
MLWISNHNSASQHGLKLTRQIETNGPPCSRISRGSGAGWPPMAHGVSLDGMGTVSVLDAMLSHIRRRPSAGAKSVSLEGREAMMMVDEVEKVDRGTEGGKRAEGEATRPKGPRSASAQSVRRSQDGQLQYLCLIEHAEPNKPVISLCIV